MQCKHFLTLVIMLSVLLAGHTQEIRSIENGKKVIVHPDGSVQNFPNFGVPSGALFDPKDAPDYKPSETTDKYPVFVGTVLPMNNVYVDTEEDARKIFVRRMQIAQEAAIIADQRAKEAKLQREKLESEFQKSQATNQSEENLRHLKIRLEAARKTEMETQQEVMQARQEAGKADELTKKGGFLNALAKDQRTKVQQPTNTEALEDDFYRNIFALDESGNVEKIPTPECQTAYEGKDEVSGQIRKDLQQQLLFTYTDERLRPYLKDKEYLRCDGFLTAMGGFRFLSLQFTFAYPNAREAYGFIEKGSILIIKLLDGSFVNLPAMRMDKGSYNTEKEMLTYNVYYPLDRSQINLLRRGDVDSIIMFWSSGYEEYPVYNVTFFANQFNCLEK